MKKILLLFSFSFLITITLSAQTGDVRTLETKVADLLMQMPPAHTENLNSLMKELREIGVPAFSNIASKVTAPGAGNDVAARYAVSGFAKYIGKNKNDADVDDFAIALCNVIDNKNNDEAKDFLLQELQFFAGNESVPFLKKYLHNARLADPAARVLARINTPLAQTSLLNALSGANNAQKTVLVNTLGSIKYDKATKAIEKLINTNDKALKKSVLFALSEMGNASSAKLLKREVQKVNYQYESGDVTDAYLDYLTNAASTNKKLVATEARNLLNSNAPQNVKTAALSLLNKSNPDAAFPLLLSAIDNNDEKYAASAVALLADRYSETRVAEALKAKALSSSSEFLRTQLINTISNNNDNSATPVLVRLLSSEQPRVQTAAMYALAKSNTPSAIEPLIGLLNHKDAAIRNDAKGALLSIKNNQAVISAAASALTNAPDVSKPLLIDILAQNRATQHANLIFHAFGSNDPQVRAAAAKALPLVVTTNDENRVAQLLLKSSSAEETAFLQNALYNTLDNKLSTQEQTTRISNIMQGAGNDDYKMYNVLANVGGNNALNVVMNRLYNGNKTQQQAAFDALTRWNGDSALDSLYSIAKKPANTFSSSALSNFINGINKSGNTVDQKVLMFRNAMELVKTDDLRKKILSGIANNKTLPALIFVSKYLDNAALQQAALQAANTIILGNKNIYGSFVTEIAEKAMKLNKDNEAAYQIQAMTKHLSELPKDAGFVSMFNGKNLDGWKGLVENPIARAKMSSKELAEKQAKADQEMRRDWRVENGVLVFEGKGYNNLVSEKMYEDFEMYVDWKMEALGDGGVYLRGSPQVQTWDTSRTDVGAQVGSGGLYNNQVHRSTPLKVADNPINEWNTFYIKMIGERVTVYLNGELVTDNVILENYWDRKIPIFDREAIELQAHGTRLEFRDVYVREIARPKAYELSAEEKREGFVPLFNGVNLDGWTGNKINYYAEGGMLVSNPANKAEKGSTRNLYTEKQYSDFIMRFEFQLTPGANNGLGIRTPLTGDAAYEGMELQILDNDADIYKNLKPYQFHGSVYGVIPALKGYLKPVGEWNYQEVKALGNRITVTLNGKVILDGDIAEASKNNTETIDGKAHPGLLNKSGHIGFLGHGSPLSFRNIRIKEL